MGCWKRKILTFIQTFIVFFSLCLYVDSAVNVLELFIKLLPASQISSKTCLKPSTILGYFEKILVQRLIDAIKMTISVKKLVK